MSSHEVFFRVCRVCTSRGLGQLDVRAESGALVRVTVVEDLVAHCREVGDADHLALEVMES